MTKINDLTDHFTAMYEIAPELFLEITDEATCQKAIASAHELSTHIAASDLRPHPASPTLQAAIKRIAAYEEQAYDISSKAPGGVSMLKFLMEQGNLSQGQLAELTGIQQSTISKIISGERKINADHAKAFAKQFKINVSVFLTS